MLSDIYRVYLLSIDKMMFHPGSPFVYTICDLTEWNKVSVP